MHATTVAVDLAKEVFELAFSDAHGRVIERKRLTRRAFARAFDQRPALRIVMEACGSAHHWARRFERQGHAVRLLPASDVRPYVRGNKTDRHDAAGILEADRCGDIASVPVKTLEQQAIQAQHRMREHLKTERTATINLLRGVLREFGVTIPGGSTRVPGAVRDALEDGDNGLPMPLRHSLGEQLQRLAQLQADLHAIERRLDQYARRDAAVQRYLGVPGVGLLTATALRAGAGDLSRFKSGRQLSAWLGLTPREHSSGQQRRLGRMTKRGDAYLRTLFIHGARAVLQGARLRHKRGQPLDPLQAWALGVQDKRGHNKAACALANKLARRLWAMEHHGKPFDPRHLSRQPIAA
jgi:transposase